MENMDNKRSSSQESVAHNSGQHTPNEVASSPSNSSSGGGRQQHRVVELLYNGGQEANEPSVRWVFRPEFYNEDLTEQEDDNESDTDDGNGPVFVPVFLPPTAADDDEEEEEQSDDDHDEDDEFEMLDINIERARQNREVFGANDETDDEDDEDVESPMNYDRTLPATHQYLGDNLEESRGRRVLAECSINKLPVLNLPEVILFPGQTLPLTTPNLNDRILHCFRTCLSSGLTTIGIMSNPPINKIGTTAEIRNFAVENENQLKLILEGRQRFMLLSAPFESVVEATIKILPEITLGHPFPSSSSYPRFFTGSANIPSKYVISKHPHWLLNQYEARNMIARITSLIKDWCSGADLSQDPNEFSYWLASCLPISDRERIIALSYSCAEARLLWLLGKIENSDRFVCAGCGNVICSKSEVFSMSQSGPQCSFVNQNGFIHDTLTVRHAGGVLVGFNWSKEFSWFPGYAWGLAHCDACDHHIGWCFRRLESHTKPKRFFGLSRTNVRLAAPNKPPEETE